ncbi:hypothetical protein DFH07DRAFT_779378 [Mycena maculata]|uniref:Uncharacterized protein n=1 Tax=Mycena maculata TaxID=230809 RepID=A0AAD7I8I1_9AGAR|nr:hypothetical protein DFH07DRAFT_779378 [Mycena maculata]
MQPPSTTKTVRHLLWMIPEIDDDASKTEPFLGSLGSFADTTSGLLAEPLFFPLTDLYVAGCTKTDHVQQQAETTPPVQPHPLHTLWNSVRPHTLQAAVHFHRRACCMVTNLVGKSVTEWANENMHGNIMVLIHTQDSCQRSPGKVLLICGPKITDVQARERKAEKVIDSCMFQFLEVIDLRFTQVWVNNECRE